MPGPDPDAADELSLRRASPSRQALTLFGDYWWQVAEWLPTGALLAALADLGVKEPAARATLARLVKLGLLEAQRDGRRTSHRLTARGRSIVDEEAVWLDGFGVREIDWDGQWDIVLFSVPEAQRALRHSVRSRLRWYGFAPLYDGAWISPRASIDRLIDELALLGVVDVSVMRGALRRSSSVGAETAWDLEAARHRYRAIERSLDIVRDERMTASVDALRWRSRLILEWQALRGIDAGLPESLLPPDWPRMRVRERLAAAYDLLAPDAEARMREHIERIDPDLAALVRSRTLTREDPTPKV